MLVYGNLLVRYELSQEVGQWIQKHCVLWVSAVVTEALVLSVSIFTVIVGGDFCCYIYYWTC